MSKRRNVTVPISSVEDYIRLMNGLFGLTDMEIAVLGKFIYYDKTLNDPDIDTFSPAIKQKISDELNVSDINGYVYKLKSKNALIKNGTHYKIHQLLMPGDFREVVIKLKFDNEENS